MNPYRLILSLLLASFLSVTATVDMRGQSIVYQADYSGSDFSAFGPNGGTIGVRFASQNVGSSGLPAEFYIAYNFSGWDQQNFSYVADSSFGELSIRIAETYSGTIADTSRYSIASAPDFGGFRMERILDQAGMSLLGFWQDPNPPHDSYFWETVFEQVETTPINPPAGIFKSFDLFYQNDVPPQVPVGEVLPARYTVFSDTITYSAIPEPGMLAFFALGLSLWMPHRRPLPVTIRRG